jgi:hypothetical protein
MSNMAYTPDPQTPSAVPQSQQLSKNPQLPQHPLGAYTDASYEADVADLRREISQRYADVLQQLGYQDPATGQFIMGSVETEANRQRALQQRELGLAGEGVTQDMQRNGTLFSGYRGTQQARAEFPYVQAISDITRTLPGDLSSLYEKGAGLIDEFTTRNGRLLADAASRRAADITASGGGGGATTEPNPNDVTGGAGPPASDTTPGGVPILANGLPAYTTAMAAQPSEPTSQGSGTYDVGGYLVNGAPNVAPTPPLPNQGSYIVGGNPVAVAPPPVRPRPAPLPGQGSYIVGGRVVRA